MNPDPLQALRDENTVLRHRLEDAEATLRAISQDEVDAFLVRRGAEEQVLVLDGVDRPYRLLIEQMNQAAVTITADGTIIYTNRRFTEMLQWPATKIVGGTLQQHIHPPQLPRLLAILELGLHNSAEDEFTLVAADGLPIPVSIAISPLVENIGILCLIVTDLTERERHAAERAARLAAEATAGTLADASRRKDEFLAMLAHELRGPLAPLRNAIALVGTPGVQQAQLIELHDMMRRQMEHLVRLVDDLLDASRVTQGKIRLQPARVDLRTLVDRAIESARSLVDARQHRLVVEECRTELPVNVDAVRIGQAIHNLLSNAAKFTPAGGEILVRVARDGDQATVLVRDSGVGIAPDKLAAVFELFVQVDPTVSRVEGGLGIGLTLARRLVELHDGTLDGHSDGANKGTAFMIRLPLVPATGPGASRQRPESGQADAVS